MASGVRTTWGPDFPSGGDNDVSKLRGREFHQYQDSRNPAFISAQASALNAGVNAQFAGQQAAATTMSAEASRASAGANVSQAATAAKNQQSMGANTRAMLELQLAQMRTPSSFASIMAGADQQRDMVDQRYTGAMADIQRGGDQQVSDYMAMMQGVGDASRQRIYRDSTADRNSVGSQLAGTGLYNSTVLGSVQQGINRNRNEAIGQLDEGLRREKASYLSELTGRALDRRQAMSASQLSSLGSMASQRMSMDADLRGQERDTSSINPALLNLISQA